MGFIRNVCFVGLLVVMALVRTGASAAPRFCAAICSVNPCNAVPDGDEHKVCYLGEACAENFQCAQNTCALIANTCGYDLVGPSWNGFCTEPEEQYYCVFNGVDSR